MDSLARTGLVLFTLLALHLVDHAVNQPSRDVPAFGGLIGAAGFAIVALAIILALRGSPYAPEAAIVAGVGSVFGFVFIHLLPDWTPLSDPYWDFDANALSWVLVVAPLIASLVLAAEGVRRLSDRAVTA